MEGKVNICIQKNLGLLSSKVFCDVVLNALTLISSEGGLWELEETPSAVKNAKQ